MISSHRTESCARGLKKQIKVDANGRAQVGVVDCLTLVLRSRRSIQTSNRCRLPPNPAAPSGTKPQRRRWLRWLAATAVEDSKIHVPTFRLSYPTFGRASIASLRRTCRGGTRARKATELCCGFGDKLPSDEFEVFELRSHPSKRL